MQRPSVLNSKHSTYHPLQKRSEIVRKDTFSDIAIDSLSGEKGSRKKIIPF
jgi:hypothetical protein